ncbi:SDR family oxidoreductase [Chloroflexota bacterium]
MYKRKKVIVTGGAGFIGSHLVERLVSQNYFVAIVDNLSTGKLKNIEHLLNNKNVHFIKADICDLSFLQDIFQGASYVFHQAAIPSVSRSIENPLVFHEVNTTGTLKVLLAARDNGISKVVYASSSSVYGDTPSLPKSEDILLHPQSPYAITKLASEHYCRVFEQVYNLSTVCLRYFNVYGIRQDPNSEYSAVIPKFINRVSHGKPPIIFGDGEQTRDFTFVEDVVNANIQAAESEITGIFNIAKGESISLKQLAKMIISLIGVDVESIYADARPGDIKHSLAAISHARLFNYKPKWSLEAGLRETITKWS